MALNDLPARNAAGAALVVVGLVTMFGTMFKTGVLGFYPSEFPGILGALGFAMACLLLGSRLFHTPLPSRPPQSTTAPVVVRTDREIAQEAEDEALASAEREKTNAERRQHFLASGSSLVALLADPVIAKEARQMRRLYGRRACLDLLRRKAAELGLETITITEDELPETF